MNRQFVFVVILVVFVAAAIGMETQNIKPRVCSLYINDKIIYTLTRESVSQADLITTSERFVQVEVCKCDDSAAMSSPLVNSGKNSSACKSLYMTHFQYDADRFKKKNNFKYFSISAFQNRDGTLKKNNEKIEFEGMAYVLANVEDIVGIIERTNAIRSEKVLNATIKNGVFGAAIPTFLIFGLIGMKNVKNISSFMKALFDEPIVKFVQENVLLFIIKKLFRL